MLLQRPNLALGGISFHKYALLELSQQLNLVYLGMVENLINFNCNLMKYLPLQIHLICGPQVRLIIICGPQVLKVDN